LALILNAPVVSKIAYAQVRMGPSSNGVPVSNPMTRESGMVGSNAESGRNSAVQSVTGAIRSLHGSSGIGTLLDIRSVATDGHVAIIAGIGFILASLNGWAFKFHQHKQNLQVIK
jgi:hypothetical protein